MAVEQVFIEFIPDLTQLAAAEERLTSMGLIDQKSAIIFKATNDQLKAREGLTTKAAEATTKEQAIVNKLVASLKNLSGESKTAVQNLLKLSTEEISAGFIKAGISVDDYVEKLKKTGDNQADFKPVNDQLKAQDLLYGKLTLSVTKEQSAVNKLVASLKNLTGESKKSVQDLLSKTTEEIAQGFEDAGISVDEYIAALSKTGGATEVTTASTVKLKTQLRAMVEELARLKLAGLDQTDAYRKLAAEAGNLSDTIGDTSAEIKRLGSDTGVFDGLIAGVQGLAGGFAIAQGATALFGDSSEELQETLLRVNAAMAILQGLQQVQNSLQAESALSLLVVNLQRKVQNAQIVIENGLQSRSVVVRLAATVAQKALNLAMSLNPIGIVITALVTVIGLFAIYANSAKKAAEQQAALNGALKEAGEGLDSEIAGIKRANSARVSELEAAGAKQSAIQRANTQAEVLIQQQRLKTISELDKVIAKNRDASDEDALKSLQDARDKRAELEQQSADASLEIENKNREGRKQILLESLEDAVSIKQAEIDKILSLGGKNTDNEFAARKALARAQAALDIQSAGESSAKVLAIRKKLNNDLHQIDIESRDQRQKETLSSLETELVNEQIKSKQINERESQTEIDIKKKIILTTAKFESEQEGLSEKQRTEIRVKALQETTQIQREFSKKAIEETLQDYISLNNVELSRTEITEEDKLNIKIDNIIAAASIEEEQNKGLTSKIKEINAKRDADIKAARLQSIQDTLAEELKSFEVGFAEANRAIERQLAAQDQLRSAPNNSERKRLEQLLGVRKLSIDEENRLIDEQTKHILDGLDMEIAALKEELKEKLISQEDYTAKYLELIDQEKKAVEDAEQKKRDAAAKTAKDRKDKEQAIKELAVQIAGEIGNLAFEGFQNQLDRQQQAIDSQRQKINDLKEAGSISEKEAVDRLKQIDREERKLKTQQAQKDKEAAIFNAVINTAQAVLKAYATTGPIAGAVLAAIVGAIGAAQIAIIASRPVPKFAKGKKDRYEGLGQVGEAGAELIESKGQMYIAKEPTIIWLGAKDKVYNPKETKVMMNKALPTIKNNIMVNGKETKQAAIDYEKLGKAIGRHTSTTTSLSIDGYKDFLKEKNSFITYLNNRRGY